MSASIGFLNCLLVFLQNVVARVANLPLVSTTYDMVSHVYCNTKDSHPYIKSVCEVAEMGVKTISSVAFTSAMPIIGKLELQSKSFSFIRVEVLL